MTNTIANELFQTTCEKAIEMAESLIADFGKLDDDAEYGDTISQLASARDDLRDAYIETSSEKREPLFEGAMATVGEAQARLFHILKGDGNSVVGWKY